MADAERWSYVTGEKGRNRVTAYERSSGIIYLEFFEEDPETGELERCRVSTGHRDRERAKQQADELAAEFGRSGRERKPAVTLRELFDKFMERRRSQLDEDRERYYGQMRELFCRYLGPDREVGSLNRDHWDRFVEDRASGVIDARGRPVAADRREPRSPNTVKKNLKALRAVIRWGVGADLLATDPTEGYPLPSEPSPAQPRVTQERYEAMLETAGEVDWRAELALVLAHETGHRIGAVRRLKWSEVDLETGAVHWCAGTDKSGHRHTTPLTGEAEAALRRARARDGVEASGWVFPAPEDASRPCSRNLARDWWCRMEEAAGLEPVDGLGWHGLRRKFADELRDASPKEIADLGGWKTPRTVIEVYQGSDLEAMRRAQQRRRTLGNGGGSG